jgi:hypothetical protein
MRHVLQLNVSMTCPRLLVKKTEDCCETPGRGPRSRADPSSLCSFSQVIDEVEIAASLRRRLYPKQKQVV